MPNTSYGLNLLGEGLEGDRAVVTGGQKGLELRDVLQPILAIDQHAMRVQHVVHGHVREWARVLKDRGRSGRRLSRRADSG